MGPENIPAKTRTTRHFLIAFTYGLKQNVKDVWSSLGVRMVRFDFYDLVPPKNVQSVIRAWQVVRVLVIISVILGQCVD